MRLFVAVWPPPDVLELLGSLERPAGVRWTSPEQWHVTLRFLGDVPASAVPALADALPGGPAGTAALGPATARLGPSVLVVPVAGLEALAEEVRRRTVPLVPEEDRRSFRGHLTLARARRGSKVPAALAGTPVAAAWPVRRLSLVRSDLSTAGARYEEVAGVDLAEGP